MGVNESDEQHKSKLCRYSAVSPSLILTIIQQYGTRYFVTSARAATESDATREGAARLTVLENGREGVGG